jgi:hypothetical protein
VAKITPITEHFQHFLANVKETFGGDVYGQTKRAWQKFLKLESQRQRDRFRGWRRYERGCGQRRDCRNGYYERDFVTRLGTLRLRIAHTRGKSFLPRGIERFQRRAEEVAIADPRSFVVNRRLHQLRDPLKRTNDPSHYSECKKHDEACSYKCKNGESKPDNLPQSAACIRQNFLPNEKAGDEKRD